MSRKKALVVGASGVIGHAVVKELLARDDWDVLGISRRGAPYFLLDVPWVSLDITDLDALENSVELSDVTHVFYAAYCPDSNLAEEARVNDKMIRTLLRGLKRAPLERVILYQGGKVYDLHLGPVKTPMRETDPRHMPPNFYFDQEDTVKEAAAEGGWSYTILRPDLVYGAIPGQPLNHAMAIASYAAFCKVNNAAFRFPGSEKAYRALVQATDSNLLARVSIWAASAEIAANEVYNVSNGDTFRWEHLWPWLTEKLGFEQAGPPMGIRLVDHMRDKGDSWARLAKEHNLIEPEYEKAVGWSFGDFIFHTEHDIVFDLIKLRQHGCYEVARTDEALLDVLRELQNKKIVPPIFRTS